MCRLSNHDASIIYTVLAALSQIKCLMFTSTTVHRVRILAQVVAQTELVLPGRVVIDI